MRRRTFLASAATAIAAPEPVRPPNFVMLFADDMGYGDLSCYGQPVIRTPNLDRMAAEGTRFTSFYAAASVCTPSRVGLLTGRYAVRAGQPNNTGPDTVGGLPLSEKLLPQLLRPRGYRSMAIGKWHLGYKPAEYLPVHRGFDHYFGLPYSNDMIPPFVKTNQPLELYRDDKAVEEIGDQSNLTERYTAEAIRFIRESAANPFFLYLPYSMPHLPVSAGERFRGRSRGGLYGDVIEAIDWSAGQILASLQEEGLDNNTMVVFASDNGPWHDLPPRMLAKGNQPWHTGSKGLLRGAKGTTWEGGPRVPGIFRWPGQIPAGRISPEIASTLDLLPAFVRLAGGELPADRTYDGFDLMPYLRGEGPPPRNEFFYFLGKRLEAVREGPWKLRYAGNAPGEAPLAQLFDLENDPAERYDQRAENGQISERLMARLRAFAAEVKADVAG